MYDQASLKEENDSLRWQLDAYRNEVDLLRREQNKCTRADEEHPHGPEAQVQLLQQSLHSMQQVGSASSSVHSSVLISSYPVSPWRRSSQGGETRKHPGTETDPGLCLHRAADPQQGHRSSSERFSFI